MSTPWWRPKKISFEDFPMPTLEHLEELRARLIKISCLLIFFSTLSYLYVEKILFHLTKSAGTLVFTRPTEAFFVRIKLAFYLGLILAMPFIFYQLWGFVAPALKSHERKH
ncbi:MAG: twin-arginine translocase subunit TatC, partial [Oligoflexia bacterium]|nr:twin-arginine translocase subunit TatC [Oligoflexia bacterium]